MTLSLTTLSPDWFLLQGPSCSSINTHAPGPLRLLPSQDICTAHSITPLGLECHLIREAALIAVSTEPLPKPLLSHPCCSSSTALITIWKSVPHLSVHIFITYILHTRTSFARPGALSYPTCMPRAQKRAWTSEESIALRRMNLSVSSSVN